jgi:uroporphyrinogen-III synthase
MSTSVPRKPVQDDDANRRGLPLAGRRIVVSRAPEQAGALSAKLRELGATVLEIPFIQIRQPRSFRALDTALRHAGRYHWLILTSVNGVQALFGRLEALKLPLQTLSGLRIAAIGPATKAAIEARGVAVEIVPKQYIAESVVARLKNKVRGRRVLLVRAKVARDVIPRELRQAGAQVDVIEAYETVVPRASRAKLLAALRSKARRPDAITFTSSSTARNFAKLLGSRLTHSGLLESINLASIGPVTTATLRELGLEPQIRAREYTMDGLVAAIVKKLK